MKSTLLTVGPCSNGQSSLSLVSSRGTRNAALRINFNSQENLEMLLQAHAALMLFQEGGPPI